MKRFYIIPLIILTFFLTSFDKYMEANDNDGKFVVVLDAGHGGHDPGNLGNGYLEKNIALKMLLNLFPKKKIYQRKKFTIFV